MTRLLVSLAAVAVVAAAVAAMPGTALADVTVKVKVVDHKKGGAPETQLIKASGKKLAFPPPSSAVVGKRQSRGASRAIYDGNTKTLIVEDDQRRTFTRMDEKILREYSALADANPQASADAKKQLEAAEAELERALANAPAGQRAFIKQMFEKRIASLRTMAGEEQGEWRIDKKGTVMVGTVLCTRYHVSRGKTLEKEILAAPFSAVGPAKEAQDAYGGFVDFMKGMPGRAGENGKRLAKELATINAYYYVTRDYENGRVVRQTEFVEALAGKIDPKEFERNPKYTEEKMPKPGLPPGMPPMPPR